MKRYKSIKGHSEYRGGNYIYDPKNAAPRKKTNGRHSKVSKVEQEKKA
jgi:hypothetical protein